MGLDSKSSALVPPRLLAGVTLLYWGAMTGEALVALIIAVLLEGKNWVKWSWDFDDASYVKAFQVSLGLLGFVLLMVWLGDVDRNSLYQVMKWFPLCLLPIELAQRYGKCEKMNLNTFFYFSRQRMKQDLKEGRSISPKAINTGYPYLFIVIVVGSCASRMDVFVHVAMLGLMTAVILAVSVKRGLGWRRLVWALPVMLLMAVWIQSETATIYKSYMTRGRAFKDPGKGESSPRHTNLGQLGEMKQSLEIQWRMWGDDVPEYLRLNSYNKHYGGGWRYDYEADPDNDFETIEDAFESGPGIEIGGDGKGLFVFGTEYGAMLEDSSVARSKFTLRGKGQSDTEQSIVPSSAGLFAIDKMAGGGVTPSVHPLGVLKLTNRKAIIDYELWNTDQNLLDSEPDDLDLEVIDKYKELVAGLGIEMQLGGISDPRDKVNAIRDFFMQEFTYALHFEKSKIDFNGTDLERFMGADKGGRRGHCEYFATTAALLLRGQGVPTRYCTGYVAREKDGDTWLMRGSHMHAWCSAWIDGEWEIVDLTPSDWLALQSEKEAVGWSQGFKDWFQNIKQDFSIWRTDEDNKSLMNALMWLLGLILLIWFSYRLFRSRSKREEAKVEVVAALNYEIPKEFEFIEDRLSSVIGERSVAQTYVNWVEGAKSKLDGGLFAHLVSLMNLHEESRFGGQDKSLEIAKMSEIVKSLLNK